MDWSTILKIGHIVGTVLGAGGATFAEFQLRAAARDGRVDKSESQLLAVTYWLIRVGLILIVFSGFGYFLYFRLQPHLSFILYEPRMWAKLSLAGILVANAFLMHIRRLPLPVGAAISITGWYSALILGSWRSLEASYFLMMGSFVIILLPVIWLMRRLHKPIAPAPK